MCLQFESIPGLYVYPARALEASLAAVVWISSISSSKGSCVEGFGPQMVDLWV